MCPCVITGVGRGKIGQELVLRRRKTEEITEEIYLFIFEKLLEYLAILVNVETLPKV